MMKVMHLTASRFFGGPERQMLGLADALSDHVETVFASFSEDGLNRGFLNKVEQAGFKAIDLVSDTPHVTAAMREVRALLRKLKIDVLICHGYKGGLIGCYAARKYNVPVIAVSRGWTGENWKVRFYEQIDRRMLRKMKKVVCVSDAQARMVKAAGIPQARIEVIRNAVLTDRFENPARVFRSKLLEMFPPSVRGEIKFVIGAAGRLSPEKGFAVLIQACKYLASEVNDIDFGLVLFGDGVLRDELQRQIEAAGLSARVVLGGFTSELDNYMPHFDLFVQSSHTEGLPNVLLEAAAAGIPVVATDVGGTREVVVDGSTGLIVPPNEPQALAIRINELWGNGTLRAAMQAQAAKHIVQNYTFAAQATAYRRVFASVLSETHQCV